MAEHPKYNKADIKNILSGHYPDCPEWTMTIKEQNEYLREVVEQLMEKENA